MKIESILKRKNGTKISLGGIDYHFKPDEKGRHVANVTDQAHLAKLLSIPEGYRLVLDDEEHGKPQDTPVINIIQESELATDPEPGSEDTPEPQQSLNNAEIKSGNKDKHGRLQTLVDQFSERFGRVPHHAWNDERIKSELSEA